MIRTHFDAYRRLDQITPIEARLRRLEPTQQLCWRRFRQCVSGGERYQHGRLRFEREHVGAQPSCKKAPIGLQNLAYSNKILTTS
jgi:hypothetical protein